MSGPRRRDRKTLRDLIPSAPLVQRLYCTSKEEAIEELLNALVIDGVLDLSRERETYQAILDRERVASTGIGRGIAVPHNKNKFAARFGLAVGISEEGIDFAAHDRSLARVIFLWVCPPADTKAHLALMRGLAATAKDDPDAIDKLANCRDRKGIVEVLGQIEVEEKK